VTEAPDPAARPHILLTNDDGIQAPGLRALAEAFAGWARVSIVAPERNWSAAGHTKTMHKPLRVWPVDYPVDVRALATSGSPSDCVAMALLGLLSSAPDLVVSGINPGANVGHDLTYSGTVAAAMEAVIGGVPGVAVSIDSYDATDYGGAARFAAYLAQRIVEVPLDMPLLLNVNVPAGPAQQIRGVQVTRLGRRLYRDALVERRDPRGRAYYWIGGDPPDGIPEEGTDIGALASGHVSVTPILLDLTDRAGLDLLRGWQLAYPHAE